MPPPAQSEREAPRSAVAWQITVLLSLAFAINYVDRQFLFAAFPRLAKDLSLSSIQLGLAGSLFTWSYAASMPLAGWIADRSSRSRVILSAIALWSAACLGTAFSLNAAELFASRIAMGLTESLYFPAAVRLIADYHTGRTRSRALALHAAAQFAGITLGGIYGGWSADHIGWRTGYASLTAIGLLCAAALRGRIRDVPAERQAQSPLRNSSEHLLRSPLYYLIALAFFLFCAMLWVIYAWTATFIHQRYHLDLAASGLDAVVYVESGAAAGVLIGGWVGDLAALRSATGRADVTACGLLLCGPFAALIFTTHSLLSLKTAAVAFGLCSGLFIANIFASLYEVAPRGSFSFATGLLNMVGGLGGGVAILLAGVMNHPRGIGDLMHWISAASVLAAICLLAGVRFGRFPLRPPPAQSGG